MQTSYRVEIEQEEDGRFLAEVVDLPGVMAYGETADLALAHVQALALRALAFATEGTVGYIIGGYARETGQPDLGKFTLTLRKDADDRWLIASDMENGNSRSW